MKMLKLKETFIFLEESNFKTESNSDKEFLEILSLKIYLVKLTAYVVSFFCFTIILEYNMYLVTLLFQLYRKFYHTYILWP